MAEECPVCLETLSGTVVQLGCCKKQVHIQCYITKCPMCRSDLPAPIHALEPQHVIVPVPVAVHHVRKLSVLPAIFGTIVVAGMCLFIVSPYFN
jgi:hypothetical protein